VKIYEEVSRMDINSVTQLLNATQTNQGTTNNPIPGAPPQENPAQTPPVANGGFGAAGVYQAGVNAQEPQSFQADMNRVRDMWNSHQQQVDSFRRMVETLLNQQAERQGFVSGWNIRDIEVTDEMRAEAQEMIDEGGYFSVESTATRLLDFAVAISGGDPSRIDLLRDAVQRGFDQAERMFGGELPEISHQTLEAVMNGFDEWAASGSAASISLLANR